MRCGSICTKENTSPGSQDQTLSSFKLRYYTVSLNVEYHPTPQSFMTLALSQVLHLMPIFPAALSLWNRNKAIISYTRANDEMSSPKALRGVGPKEQEEIRGSATDPQSLYARVYTASLNIGFDMMHHVKVSPSFVLECIYHQTITLACLQ
ncbi:hypothetical protein P8452_25111 [Trifolium repens]|nr:hypothetical protein P8452_25111 [Trifolium repens]